MEEVDGVLDLGGEDRNQASRRLPSPVCLVGRVFSDKPVNSFALMDVMIKAFRVNGSLTVRDWGNGLLIFMFDLEEDRRWVLRNQPWHFDNALFAIKPLSGREQPSAVTFSTSAFWIRVLGKVDIVFVEDVHDSDSGNGAGNVISSGSGSGIVNTAVEHVHACSAYMGASLELVYASNPVSVTTGSALETTSRINYTPTHDIPPYPFVPTPVINTHPLSSSSRDVEFTVPIDRVFTTLKSHLSDISFLADNLNQARSITLHNAIPQPSYTLPNSVIRTSSLILQTTTLTTLATIESEGAVHTNSFAEDPSIIRNVVNTGMGVSSGLKKFCWKRAARLK
ncbi:hypothetical protein ACS0TY_014347 [Phlomoides rotata]